jgi:Bacteriophage T4-like portal protein (Gp20)
MTKKQKLAQRGIVFYINVGNLPPNEVAAYISNVKQKLDNDEEVHYYIPVRNEATRVELLWMKG